MTLQVEVSPEIEARIVAEAQARGVSAENYALGLLEQALANPANPPSKLTVEKFHAMLSGLAEGSERLPELPTDSFTRESFYEDSRDRAEHTNRNRPADRKSLAQLFDESPFRGPDVDFERDTF